MKSSNIFRVGIIKQLFGQLLGQLTLHPISVFPCQINQISDNSRTNNCIILHANKYSMIAEKPIKLTFIIKDKCRSMMRQILQQNFCLTTYADGGTTESLCSVTKAFSHTIKQSLHQYLYIIRCLLLKYRLIFFTSLESI